MKISSDRLLKAYSAVLTLAVAAFLLSGARSPKKASFDEITVERINMVEPDGTPRLIIAGKKRFPGTYLHGKETARGGQSAAAGFLFLDDEGTEIGGQRWAGHKRPEGEMGAGHLSFDRYNGDQTFAVNTEDVDGKTRTWLMMNDSYSGIEAALKEEARIEALPADQRHAELEKYAKKFPQAVRVELGSERDMSAALKLNDGQGRSRLVMAVAPDGSPSIELRDEAGTVIARLPERK